MQKYTVPRTVCCLFFTIAKLDQQWTKIGMLQKS